MQNKTDRAYLKSCTDRNNRTVQINRERHLKERQDMRNHSMTLRLQKEDKSRKTQANWYQDVTRQNNAKAEDNAREAKLNEIRIKQLAEKEAQMVKDLQRTLQKKNDAVSELVGKSKGLKNVM